MTTQQNKTMFPCHPCGGQTTIEYYACESCAALRTHHSNDKWLFKTHVEANGHCDCGADYCECKECAALEWMQIFCHPVEHGVRDGYDSLFRCHTCQIFIYVLFDHEQQAILDAKKKGETA